ncbi:MAG: FG-GAP-like repeat-containing protein [Acidobacteriota bacterium]
MKAPVIWTLLGLLGFTAAAAETQNVEEEIWRHRNLGKAFYENPATQYDAVGEFEKALALAPDSVRERVNFGLALLRAGKVEEAIVELEQAQKADPSIPHTWFNLGIAYKQASRYDDAIHQLVGMVERIDDDAISHYNLGVLYKLTGAGEKSLHHFERSTELDPSLAGPHFQLATAYRQAKRVEDSKHHMKVFRKLKKRNEGAAVPEDLEWSWWAEIYETLEPEAARPAGPAATLAFDAKTVATGVDAATSSLTVFDADGDGSLDLLHASGSGLGLLLAGEETTDVGLGDVKGVRAVAPGDFDNDGLKDLALVTAEGPSLWRNLGDRFERTAVALPAGDFQALLWVDYDHDYDLDLFLLGADQKLARNKGEAGFDEQTAQFPFAEGKAVAAARFDVVSDTQGADIAVSYTGKGGVLYRDRLGGNYEAVPLRSIPAGAKHLLGADVDHDGWTDLVAVTADRMAVLINSQRQTFRPTRGPAGAGAPMVFADLENRGVPELMTGAGLFRNLGEVRFEPWPGGGLPTSPKAVTSADFDSDGRTDLAAVTDDGEVVRLLNRIDAGNHWLRVAVAGTKNLLLAPGSEIEVKVGSRYQKRIYEGVPLTFGIGDRDTVDTVRISWPNGLIQNEAQKPANTAHDFKEAQRLSGSCPMIFTWNGEEFEFITDVLGVAPLGASAGEGEVFPVDHDEWIQIAGESLVAREGVYEIRITEELREVAYLDEVRLVAVDHPADLDVFINDKFKGPPFPEFRLFGTTERHYPKQALDHRGQDVRPQLASLDKTYPDGYERNMAGVAELHHLERSSPARRVTPDNRRSRSSDSCRLITSRMSSSLPEKWL